MNQINFIKSAWLVTWEGYPKDHYFSNKTKIAAVFSARLTEKSIMKHVEILYFSHYLSAWDWINMANDQRRNPFPAQYSNKGPQCFGAITCGDNPFLLARKVKNLKVFLSDQGMAFECDEVVKPSGISKRIK